MDKLNKDELFTLSLHLDLPELLTLCESYHKFNEKICKDPTVWQRKIARDFPEFKFEDLIPELKKKSFKEIYTLLYAKRIWRTPNSINQIYNSREIDLQNDDIPDYISLPNLKYLWIENDELHTIPEHVNFPNLRYIYVSPDEDGEYYLKVPERFRSIIRLPDND